MIWQEVLSNLALSCVVGVAIILVVALLFLFALVISLTFDCWWTLGRFFNIEDDTNVLLEEMDDELAARKPWLLRLQNGKLHTVKAYDVELI